MARDGEISLWKRSIPALFFAVTILQLSLYTWPRRWLISGAPTLTFFLLQGDASGNRVLPFCHIWSLFTTINLTYAVASTSWLLYWVFTIFCYVAIACTCLFQFPIVGRVTRRILRKALNRLHFIGDKIALFDIPALEIDTGVYGLMVLRGFAFSLSSLSFVVHGVEVGLKLSDDMEMAIRTDRITVSLFRSINVGDCFINLKAGAQGVTKLKSDMTDGPTPKDTSNKAAYKSITKKPLQNASAIENYRTILRSIDDTSAIRQATTSVESFQKNTSKFENESAFRAAVCSQLHEMPSVHNPPHNSVTVTTLRKLSRPSVKRLMHRSPMLLRLLLNPLAYFHPVKIQSITTTASGQWIKRKLMENMFKKSNDCNVDYMELQDNISSWLSGATFAVELGSMAGQAHVPLLPSHDIRCHMDFEGAVAHRAMVNQENLNQILSIGGIDGSFVVPTFLLPHHEHLVPDIPSQVSGPRKGSGRVMPDDDKQIQRDIANVKTSIRAHLPIVLDQDVLDFAALLAKASKIVEIDQVHSPKDTDSSGFGEFKDALDQKMKDGFTRMVMGGDQLLAKLAGKLIKKLEFATGDLGYSGNIPVQLAEYRNTGWVKTEGTKLLP